MANAKGYDVSNVPQGIPSDAEFVFIRATEGGHTDQPGYTEKLTEARRRGLVVGHYHVLHAENPVEGEVAHFCRVVGEVPAGELLVLDFEPQGQPVSDTDATTAKNQWLSAVKGRYPDNRVGLYTNRDAWFRTDATMGDFLWIADHAEPGAPRIQAPWRFHEYSDDPLDADLHHGSAADLRAWAGGAPPGPEPAPTPVSHTDVVAAVHQAAEAAPVATGHPEGGLAEPGDLEAAPVATSHPERGQATPRDPEAAPVATSHPEGGQAAPQDPEAAPAATGHPDGGYPVYELALSLWRTCVPYIVAFLLVQAARLGIHLDNATVTSAVTTVFGTAYYAAFRYLEQHRGRRWGWFLGVARPPSYHPSATPAQPAE